MPFASDMSTSAIAPAAQPPRSSSGASRLPASIAGAFAAAADSLQSNLQNDEPPQEQDSGMLPQLYASRIGTRAQAFYLQHFKRFDALERSLPSWNMAAAFFTLAWCCLRGLWLEAATYLAAVATLALVWWFSIWPALPATLPPAVTAGLGAALWLVTVAMPGLLGNGWYWRKVKAQTLQAISAAPNMAQAHAALQAQACPSQNKMAALLTLALPAAAIAGASLALLPHRSATPALVKAPAVQATPAAIANVVSPVIAPVTSPAAASAMTSSAAATSSRPTHPDEPVADKKPKLAPVPLHIPLPKSTSEPTPDATPNQAPAVTAPVKLKAASVHIPAADLSTGKFYLSVGVYSAPAHAHKVLALLQKSKLPALSQKMNSNKEEVTRVRSGPFDSRKQAQKAVQKLKAAQINATIFQPADKAAKT